jgi:hypothetical protein
VGFYPFGPSLPGITQTATVYVTATGSDSNAGNSWQSAFATVQKAVSSLRVPAGWFTQVSFTTTTLARQTAVGC